MGHELGHYVLNHLPFTVLVLTLVLGLGLFLARHIAERHMGHLNYVRVRGTSVFRFLWPLADQRGERLDKSA